MSANKPKILVIDDEPTILDFMEHALTFHGFGVGRAEDGPTGIARYSAEAFDLVLVDLRMPKMDGMEVIQRLKARNPDVMVIVITAYGSIDSAVEAIKAGAADYLIKPVHPDHLEVVVRKALEGRGQAEEFHLLKSQVAELGTFEGLVGVSPGMQRVYQLIRRVSDSDSTVLILGETGTGKELVARAIHTRSRRGEFVPISCGALPETILESELFGYEKGAFTGAAKQKYGLIEQAQGGTLFLDEIEETSPALQVKLLRAIQEREVLRVGGDRPIPVDFRLLSSAKMDLRERVDQGTFRADLFYRLSVVEVELPPLRARREDIPLLANHFLTVCARKSGRPVSEITPEAMMLLKSYSWPGNVRELQNAVEQAVLLGQGETLSVMDFPHCVQEEASGSGPTSLYDLPLRQARERFERDYLEVLLSRAGGRVARAAALAGIPRQYFYEKMKSRGIPGK